MRYLFLVSVYLLTSTLPLLSHVGANLEYEYALIASYLVLLLVPALALGLPERWIPRGEDGAYAPGYAWDVFWIFLVGPLVAAAPGMVLHATRTCQCSATGFAFWMVLLWYPAFVLAHAVHHALLRSRTLGVPRWQGGLTVVLCYVLIAVATVLTLFLEPQKRLVNVVAGFLHGPIYDDWIAVDGGLPLARLSHLALATTVLLLAWVRRKAVFGIALAGAAAAWVGTAVLADRFPSVQSGKASLDHLLSGTLEGTGFTVHYQPDPGSKGPPLAVQRLTRDTEFHVGELTKILAADGEKLPHVQVYLYPDDDRKKLWFGGGSTDVTDVRTPSIHVAVTSWPHPTLRHELVHALASGFGYHGLGFHPNLAFTEGLAVALAPGPGTLSLDDGAASLLQSGRMPSVESLFSPAFWKESGGRAYTVAGSFLRDLIDTKGIAGVKALYSGKDWEEAFGTSRDALVKEWEAKILAGYDKERNALYTEALFRYPGVLNDLCPHSKADLARNRGDSFFTRMRQPIGWDPESDLLPWELKLDPKNQQARVKLWRQEIKKLALERQPPQSRLETWRDALAKERSFPPKTLEDVEAGIQEADVVRLLGDVPRSVQILQALAKEGETHALGDGSTREIRARLGIEALASQLGDQTLEWRRYLAGWRKLPDANLGDFHQMPWLLTYLKVRNERDVPLQPGELTRLLTEVTPDPTLPATFQHEWYRILAGRLMQAQLYKEAATAYGKAAGAAAPGSKDVFREHARRAEFYATKGPLKATPAGQASL